MDSSGNSIELVSMVAMEDEAEKRAHHNALERKRRDHIKDSFYCLRDAVPQLRGEKASRALILNKATDYIKCLKSKNMCHKKEIDDIRKQNEVLEQEIDKIIKLNNSLGKDKIELSLNEDVLPPHKPANPQNPASSPPTFTRITEKDKGPFIGKRNLDKKEEELLEDEEEEEETPEEPLPITKIVPVCKPEIKDTVVIRSSEAVNGPTKNPTKINIAQLGVPSVGGTIQIPASALAKALPNGFKNVTAIYKQTGNNKPIRLQIITPNGTTKQARLVTTTKTVTTPLSGRSASPITISSPTKQASDATPKKIIHRDRLLNQPIYAKHRIITSPAKKPADRDSNTENKEVKSENETKSTKNDNNIPKIEPNNENSKKEDQDTKPKKKPADYDEYALPKSNNPREKGLYYDPKPHMNSRSRYHHNMNYVSDYRYTTSQALARDPSAMATISESELAFLTRPSNNTEKTEHTETHTKAGSIKLEHGNIPILYKGSLISERDNDNEGEEPPRTQILLSARATDGSKPFACHICGKSFNMLSSLKVHEHIHVPVKKKPYPCDLCHRSFMTLRILSQHKESHYGRISNFHRQAALCRYKNRPDGQSSLGKKSLVSFATHPQNSKTISTGNNPHSPRTSITNIFHVRAASPKDNAKAGDKAFNTVTIVPNKTTININSGHVKHANQRVLPTTKVRQGQVIVQARAGGVSYKSKSITKLDSEEARNFGAKVFPLKRWSEEIESSQGEKKLKNKTDEDK